MGLLFNVGLIVFAARAVTSQLNDGVERPSLPPGDEVKDLLSDEVHHIGNEMPQPGFPGIARRKRCTQYGCQSGNGYQPQYQQPYNPPSAVCVGYGCPSPCVGYGCNGGGFSGGGYGFGGSSRRRGRRSI